MLVPHLAHLGHRDALDVRLIGILTGIVLVVVLGRIKRRERFERGHDRPGKSLGGIELVDLGLGGFFLSLVGEEDGRAILRARVVALAIELRRVVGVEKHGQELIEGDLGRIESDADGLGMARVAAADCFVVSCVRRAAGVAAFYIEHARKLLERGLGTPEAAAGEDGSGIFRHGTVV